MPRRYSEEEAQRIFALVAERQRTASGTDGLSLAELEEAASAAGLDPGLVAIAAAELDAAPHAEKTFARVPIEVVRTRVLDGPLDDDAWAGMVSAARREFGQPGMAGQIGRLREWTVLNGGTKNGTVTRLTAEPTPEGTRVTLTRSIREVVMGLTIAGAIQWAMAILFGGMALTGVEPDLWIAAAMMVTLGTLFGAGAQVGARVWRRREADRFEALLDRLELVARDTASRPTLAMPDATPMPTGRLDLDGLDLDAEAEGRAAARPRTRT